MHHFHSLNFWNLLIFQNIIQLPIVISIVTQNMKKQLVKFHNTLVIRCLQCDIFCWGFTISLWLNLFDNTINQHEIFSLQVMIFQDIIRCKQTLYAPDFMGFPGYKNPMVSLLWKMIYTNHKMQNRIKVNLKSFNQYSATTVDLKKNVFIPLIYYRNAHYRKGARWNLQRCWYHMVGRRTNHLD